MRNERIEFAAKLNQIQKLMNETIELAKIARDAVEQKEPGGLKAMEFYEGFYLKYQSNDFQILAKNISSLPHLVEKAHQFAQEEAE